ncbi:pyridoxal phosphate-dependent transferase [Naematelia encephala]|uniref:Pyridoxal phosphate-dependent transferase n=1 Tax=Naematelia encephala TaxID=71784 RepID=A0A1Y2ARX8_9TREE|nr:pyridoxal phosphate-dependent transferase [Naematelia encephala]
MSPAPALPESLDLEHHLTKRVRAATPSAMKALGKLLQEKKNLLSLAGGMPHPSLFPMQHATFTLPTFQSLDGDVTAWRTGKAPTEILHLKKTGPGTEEDEEGILDLNQVLQYGLSNGFSTLVDGLAELNELIHGKSIADASLYISCGNTDGVSKTWKLLVEPDVDTVLCEEYTFGSSLNSGRSIGAKFAPIKTDDNGMIPEDLEAVLSGWNESTQGRKPHLVYTIPCGQNPSGTVMPPERYDAIYKICQKHDVIIMEDDPYFPLQYKAYEPDLTRRAEVLATARKAMPAPPSTPAEDDAKKVAQVFNDYAGVRSYLSRDVDGRVVRIDTFSKVYGPGIRMGWVSCNSLFAERLMRIGETSTQVPNNLAQAVLASYLSPEHWGVSGFIRWMWAVRLEYQTKRDIFLDCFNKYCPPELVSTKPCGGGMFQWINVSISHHPRFRRTPLSQPVGDLTLNTSAESGDIPGLVKKSNGNANGNGVSGPTTSNTGELMDELWQFLVEESNVLLMPAKIFMVEKAGEDRTERLNFFRATFAGDVESIEKSLKSFGEGVSKWFAKG